MNQYSFHRFKALPAEAKIEQLSLHGHSLDLAYSTRGAEAVLFAYGDFYVELVVETISDEILGITCFRSVKKLRPYLQQINISEINALLACTR